MSDVYAFEPFSFHVKKELFTMKNANAIGALLSDLKTRR